MDLTYTATTRSSPKSRNFSAHFESLACLIHVTSLEACVNGDASGVNAVTSDAAHRDATPGGSASAGTRALQAAYESSFHRLVALAAMVLGGPDGADDVVQDSYILCSRRSDEIGNPSAYLATTVVNQCRNRIRRSDAGKRAYGMLPVRDRVLPTHLVEFQDALLELPEDQRVAIVLRFYLSWSTDEIAEYMACPAATVRSRVSRGLGQLRRMLRQEQ